MKFRKKPVVIDAVQFHYTDQGILLHGDLGVGKTLTAEAIAELLHRPLYSVAVGELGTDTAQLEKSLRQILDVAQIWNAVVLIDEADLCSSKG